MGEDTYYGGQNPCYEKDREQALNKSAEEEKISQLEFLNRCTEFYYRETWQEASPERKVLTLKKIDSSHDEERAYVITEDEEDLMELGKGVGTMSGIMWGKLGSMPEMLWGGLKENVYTDLQIVIMDKGVSEKLLMKLLKRVRSEGFLSCSWELENRDKLERRSLDFLNNFKNDLGKIIGRLEKGNTIELKERGFVAKNAVVFSDFEKQKFVKIDGRYYAGLKKEFPEAKFSCDFGGDFPLVALCEEEELKAIILPLTSSSPGHKNFETKIRGE